MDNLHLWLTPFGMVGSIGLLILSTTSRYIDAINSVETYHDDPNHREYCADQYRRARQIRNALTLLYVAVSMASGTVFVAGIVDLWGSDFTQYVLVIGTCVTIAIVIVASTILIRETALSLKILDLMLARDDHNVR